MPPRVLVEGVGVKGHSVGEELDPGEADPGANDVHVAVEADAYLEVATGWGRRLDLDLNFSLRLVEVLTQLISQIVGGLVARPIRPACLGRNPRAVGHVFREVNEFTVALKGVPL